MTTVSETRDNPQMKNRPGFIANSNSPAQKRGAGTVFEEQL